MQKKKRHPRAKLSVEQVKEIRRRAATKQESQRAIAKAIGVNHSSVWMVINKRSYPYVV
jgi:DNA-binding XRE family transcriptional regulator